ncbi:MAG: bifunctional D-glycero-beta-D-manno-heptose-7-phosphate kinase/D-glycero-beta-D-manno-heptose 1-phosphate adenylyltransferase HldE [Pseudomonadota bacterium]
MKINFPRLNQASVLVVGDVMLDRYWEGPAARISPEAPVPVVKVEQVSEYPGGAGNVALNLATLGCGASLLAPSGDDTDADVLESVLGAASVDTQLLRNKAHKSTVKLRVMSRQQQLIRLDFEEPAAESMPAVTSESLKPLLDGVGAVVLSDYAKGALANVQDLLAVCRKRGVPVLVDPKGSDFARYRGAHVLTPNLLELESVVGHCEHESELVARAGQLITELDLQALLVTRGEAGVTLLRKDQPELHLPAYAREVFDVTGAGDTVIATLAAGIASGTSLETSAALANLAASIVVAKAGTATVSEPELRQAMLLAHGFDRGSLTIEQLELAVLDARKRQERIVFTNGCFDVLHAGHVAYLEQARQLGDRLVVAVNSDESVERLKGAGRPINPVDRRMAVICGLEAVDWVVAFEQDTPHDLLSMLKPDVLVKGGDYEGKESVVGWEIVEAYGGEVQVLDYVTGVSTSKIVDQLS